MHIREVTREDAAEWLRMRLILWPEGSQEEHAGEIACHVESPPAGVVLVIESDQTGSLCGFVEVSVRSDYVEGATSSPVAYLEGWYVDPKFRSNGLGRQLVTAAERWAREQGFTEIASDAVSTNSTSITAHRACGFTEVETIVHFVKSLPPFL